MFPKKKSKKISHVVGGDTCNTYRLEEHKVLVKKSLRKRQPTGKYKQ